MSRSNEIALSIKDLQTHFPTPRGLVKAVDGVSLEVREGECVGLVGESGSGKSITGFSVLGLLEPPGRVAGGSIRYKGRELVGASVDELRSIRGNRIAMIFQDPMMTLNPVLSIGTQMIETVTAHARVSKTEALARSRDALARVGISSPEERLAAYPHQFSGGMRQRVAIAIALLHNPDVIIADEPTTALDVTIQAQIIAEIQKLCAESRTALIWISHDLATVAGIADRIAVMYAGQIVEEGSVDDIIDRPRHHYTRGLIGSVPSNNRRGERLRQIPGSTSSPLNRPPGCTFRPRCERAEESCAADPAMTFDGLHGYRCFFPHSSGGHHV